MEFAPRADSLSAGDPIAFAAAPPEESHELLKDQLFRDALLRERRRADRFEETFILVLITVTSGAARRSHLSQVAETLGRIKTTTDIIGWYAQGSVVGLIRPLAGYNVHDASSAVATGVRQQLIRSLTTSTASACSICVDIYSPHSEVTPP